MVPEGGLRKCKMVFTFSKSILYACCIAVVKAEICGLKMRLPVLVYINFTEVVLYRQNAY